MELNCNIDVVFACADWTEACPAAGRLACDAAESALRRGWAASGHARQGSVEVGISFVDTAEQRRLNRDYRGLDASTNVLAFPAWDQGAQMASGAPILLGDVVLSFETLSREACEQDKPIADHLTHLVVHGVLHLLGFDHRTEVEAAEMEMLEKSILAELGVPDPYCDTMSLVEPEPA